MRSSALGFFGARVLSLTIQVAALRLGWSHTLSAVERDGRGCYNWVCSHFLRIKSWFQIRRLNAETYLYRRRQSGFHPSPLR